MGVLGEANFLRLQCLWVAHSSEIHTQDPGTTQSSHVPASPSMRFDRTQEVSSTMQVQHCPPLGKVFVLLSGFSPLCLQRFLGPGIILPVPAQLISIDPLIIEYPVDMDGSLVAIRVWDSGLRGKGARMDRAVGVVETGQGLSLLEGNFGEEAGGKRLSHGHDQRELVGPRGSLWSIGVVAQGGAEQEWALGQTILEKEGDFFGHYVLNEVKDGGEESGEEWMDGCG